MPNNGGTYCWSKTAANNADIDNTVNFQEGQAPSSLNDSCRAMMTSVAKWRDDISGSLVTTGTSTQYIVSSNQDFDSQADFDGQLIAFTPHVTNGAGPVTVTVDGFANLPLRSAPNVELPAGVLVEGTPYVAKYKNADGALYLHGFFGNPYNIPIAGGMDYWGTTPPNSSFAFPFGQAISRTTYAALFDIIGVSQGAGDGSTTFNLPDKRGRLSVALDTMGGTASGRVTSAASGVDGTTIGAAGGTQAYTMQRSDLPNVSPTFTGTQQTWSANQSVLQSAGDESEGSGGNTPALDAAETFVTPTVTITPSGTIQSLNGGVTQTAQNNMPPSIVVPYIIRII